MVLIPSWEQPVVGNLSDKLGAFWELVIGSDASARSLGIGWEPGSQKISLGALKLQEGPRACQLRLGGGARLVAGRLVMAAPGVGKAAQGSGVARDCSS